MCIIVIKKAGIALPNKDTLRECFINNPDGAGYMYTSEHGVHIRKGFMKFKVLHSDLMQHTTVDNDVVLHFRIGTSGTVRCRENTHPFPVSSDCDKLRALEITCRVGCAHNGIISFRGDGTLSDTMVFIRDTLSDPVILGNIKRPSIYNLLDSHVNGSKLALMDNEGITIFGKGWITENNVMYSNNGFKHSAYNFRTGFHNDFKYYNAEYDDNNEYTRHSPKCPVCGSLNAESIHGDYWCYDCNTEFTVTATGETYLLN